MNEFAKLTKQVDDLEYRIENLEKQKVGILRKTVGAFTQSVTETFSCAVKRGNLDIEVFASGDISNIACKVDGVLVGGSNGSFMSAKAERLSLGMHVVSITIVTSTKGDGAMIICHGAL